MNRYVISYTEGRLSGLYLIREDSLARAKKVFQYAHPRASIVSIEETMHKSVLDHYTGMQK